MTRKKRGILFYMQKMMRTATTKVEEDEQNDILGRWNGGELVNESMEKWKMLFEVWRMMRR
jgi:hypothetical protein